MLKCAILSGDKVKDVGRCIGCGKYCAAAVVPAWDARRQKLGGRGDSGGGFVLQVNKWGLSHAQGALPLALMRLVVPAQPLQIGFKALTLRVWPTTWSIIHSTTIKIVRLVILATLRFRYKRIITDKVRRAAIRNTRCKSLIPIIDFAF